MRTSPVALSEDGGVSREVGRAVRREASQEPGVRENAE